MRTLENCQGVRIVCPGEIAYGNDWISSAELQALASKLGNSGYGGYLSGVARHGESA